MLDNENYNVKRSPAHKTPRRGLPIGEQLRLNRRRQNLDNALGRSLAQNSVKKGRYVGKVYPSGDITLGYSAPRNKNVYEERFDVAEKEFNSPDWATDVETGKPVLVPPTPEKKAGAVDSLIGSSAPANSESGRRRQYGQRGITSYGRRMVRSGAAILQREFGTRNIAFVTVTVPTVTSGSADRIRSAWSTIVNHFVKRIRGKFQQSGVVPHITWVSELQEKRYKRTGELLPHLHLVWRSRNDDGNWVVTADALRSIWRDVLSPHIWDDEPEWGASCDIQLVKKDAANYLSKYMSKGSSIIDDVLSITPDIQLPKQWWGMTTELSLWVKSETFSVPEPLADKLIHEGQELADRGLLKYYKRVVKLTSQGREFTACVVASLDSRLFSLWDEILNTICPHWYLGIDSSTPSGAKQLAQMLGSE